MRDGGLTFAGRIAARLPKRPRAIAVHGLMVVGLVIAVAEDAVKEARGWKAAHREVMRDLDDERRGL